jgi:hypothetical protein
VSVILEGSREKKRRERGKGNIPLKAEKVAKNSRTTLSEIMPWKVVKPE